MDAKEIGARLSELRGERSQSEVARAIGVSRSAVCNYEMGLRIPKDDIKMRLAKYFKSSVAKIFYV